MQRFLKFTKNSTPKISCIFGKSVKSSFLPVFQILIQKNKAMNKNWKNTIIFIVHVLVLIWRYKSCLYFSQVWGKLSSAQLIPPTGEEWWHTSLSLGRQYSQEAPGGVTLLLSCLLFKQCFQTLKTSVSKGHVLNHNWNSNWSTGARGWDSVRRRFWLQRMPWNKNYPCSTFCVTKQTCKCWWVVTENRFFRVHVFIKVIFWRKV